MASDLVEALSDRDIALIWDTGSVKRVLDIRLTMLEKTLVLLYSESTPMAEGSLLKSLEHSNPSTYRRDVLRKAHKERLIEYDQAAKIVRISPLGARRVEMAILPKAAK